MELNEITTQIISIGSICTALIAIITLTTQIRKPSKEKSDRIEELEKRMENVEKKLTNDSEALENQQEINSLMLQSLGALLAHGIDGNNTSEMEECRNNINKRLYSSGGSIR